MPRRRPVRDESAMLTPFGARVRALRAERGLQLKHMAAHLGVSSAYLSALERGERGRPTFTLVQGTIQYFGVIWDEADELQRLAEFSDPAPRVRCAGSGPRGVLLANRLARELESLPPETIEALLAVLDAPPALDGSAASGSKPSPSPPDMQTPAARGAP